MQIKICLKEKGDYRKGESKIDLEIGKEKEKGISLLPPGWTDSGPSPPSLSRALRTAHTTHLSRPPAPRPAPHSTPLADDSTPPISRARSHSLATALPLASRPLLSATPPSPVIRYRRVLHRPPPARRLAIITLTSSVWRLASARAILSPRLPEPSHRHHCAPSSPPRQASPVLATSPSSSSLGAYKKDRPSSTLASATSFPFPELD
jgi:hypothetical protein